jgi:hypothetical protein
VLEAVAFIDSRPWIGYRATSGSLDSARIRADMTWIPITPPQQADGELRDAYQAVQALYTPEYGSVVADAVRGPDGTSDSIVAAHSLIPQALRHSMSAFAVMMSPELPLTRAQHEMIATVVSSLNACFY